MKRHAFLLILFLVLASAAAEALKLRVLVPAARIFDFALQREVNQEPDIQ
jgi:hypothetical protein